MANSLLKLRMGYAFLQLVRDPGQLDMVFRLSDQVNDPVALQRVVDVFESTNSGHNALATKPRLGVVQLRELEKYSEGSLGLAVARHMTSRNLKFEDIPSLDAYDNQKYVKAHLYETHDIWHVVTGFDTDIAGELGLQAFYFAQFPTVLAGFLLSAGLLNTVFFKIDEREHRFNEIVRGWQLGKKAKPLVGIEWQKLWAKPLREIQKELNIA